MAKHPLDVKSRTESTPKRHKSQELSPIFSLSNDEWSTVLSFLFVGESLMLALTCKSMHENVESIAKKFMPFVPQDHWSIGSALNAHSEFVVRTSDEAVNLCSILDRNKDYQMPKYITFLSHSYTNQITPSDILKLIAHESGEMQQMKGVKIDWTDDSIKETMFDEDPDYDHVFDQITKKIAVTRGFLIKNLTIHSESCARMDMYAILSHCSNLESLDLSISEEGIHYSQKMKVGDEKEEDVVQKDGVTVPILSHLKKLIINSDTGTQFMIDLLQLTPNLELLEYVYRKEPTDDFFEFLASKCPHLKELVVQGCDDSTPMESLFTDKGLLQFLDNEPSLTRLILHHCCNISGELFTKIGKYSQLKVLHIERTAMNGDLFDQYDNVHFGGGVLSSLEILVLDGRFEHLPENFVDSIVQIAPNLKQFTCQIQHLDFSNIYEKCSKLTHIDLRDEKNMSRALETLLPNSNIRTLNIASSDNHLTIEHLKRCNWSHMQELSLSCKLPHEPVAWLQALVRACPNLAVFKLEDSVIDIEQRKLFGGALLEVLSDAMLWPNLKLLMTGGLNDEHVNYHGRKQGEDISGITQEQVLALRPFLATEEEPSFWSKMNKTRPPATDSEQCFIRDWVYIDPIRKK